ncbi:MAG: hypothetical protein DA329_11015, partial [Candidatus Nitrosocosmicus sp.]|nr:hypothetical protein [Candidatus Nitrosocosmicus sp.]
MYYTSKLIGVKILTVAFFITYIQSSEAQQISENPFPSTISLDNYFNRTENNDEILIGNTLPFTEIMSKKKTNNLPIQSDDLNSEIIGKINPEEKIGSQSHVLTLGRVDLTKETTFSVASKNIEDIVEKTIYSSKSSIVGNFINLGVGNGYYEKPNIAPFGIWTFDCQNNVDYENDPDTATHAS